MGTRNRQVAPTLFGETYESVEALTDVSEARAIEDEKFPFEDLSDVVAQSKVGAKKSIVPSITFTNGGHIVSALRSGRSF